MRKAILLAAFLTVMAGCTEKVQTGPDDPSSKTEITFGEPRVTATTRADGTVVINYPGDAFGVFGRKYTGTYSTWSEAENFMYAVNEQSNALIGVEFRRSPAVQGPVFTADEKFYWPNDGSKLVFLAYRPSQLSLLTHRNLGNQDVVPRLFFTHSGINVRDFSPVDQYPLLFSDPIAEQKLITDPSTGSPKPVEVTFRNALAKAGFTFRIPEESENTSVEVTSLQICNTLTVGDFYQNIPLPYDSDEDREPFWILNEEGNAISTLIGVNGSVGSLRLTAQKSQTVSRLVIPQVFDKGIYESYFFISYRICTEAFPEGEEYLDFVQLKDVLNSKGFELGKEYFIDITINPDVNELSFRPSVRDWETVTGEVEILL